MHDVKLLEPTLDQIVVERPEPKARLTRAQCLRAIASRPLCAKMDWKTLRGLTREP